MPNWKSQGYRLALACALAASVAVPMAMAAKTGFSSHDANDPIQFSADRLEIQKEGSVAMFLGKVEAIQGDMTLLSDEVRVYYQTGGGNQGGVSGGLTGSVTRIDSRGNVRITSRGDTAQGDWAVYDVGRQLVTMGGRVVLHQGGSVVRGSRLELNLDSGQARVQGMASTQGDQRVRGEFTPATKSKEGTSGTGPDAAPKQN
ncbi:LptA/OstA family protein [Emcibacter sp. SYSU 3D8]|uniref:LptA/OstA family protein n=1 Tax=Emcibacter sp. SYSU 3D8 TaxID=3133969 RepID=UPI0031FE8DC9